MMHMHAQIFLTGLLLWTWALASTSSQLTRNNKLTISLYYESLCPFCDNFIVKHLYPTWVKINGPKYLNLDLVPYGNGKITTHPDGSFNITCQHGVDECKLNEIHNCGLKYIPTQNLQLSFITCTIIQQTSAKAGPDCAKVLQIDYNPIRKCVNGDEGKYLHYFAGRRTDALQPPHEGVPWIIFNNAYNSEDMDEARTDLFGFICKKISGPKPAQCSNHI